MQSTDTIRRNNNNKNPIKEMENERCFCMCDCNISKYCEFAGEFIKKFKISENGDSATETKSLVILNTENNEEKQTSFRKSTLVLEGYQK